MTKQQIITVLQYSLGVSGASLGLLLLDFLSTTSPDLYAPPPHFWERLSGLFFIYLAGAYLVVLLRHKNKSGLYWDKSGPEE